MTSLRCLIVTNKRTSAFQQHKHAKRARVIFCDSIRRTVYSNELVKFFWLRCTARKKLGIYDVHTILNR